MSRYWKVLLTLAVAAPMLAYVAGTLASAREPLRTPDPVVLVEDSSAASPEPSRGVRPTPRTNPSRSADDAHGADDSDGRVVLPPVDDVGPDDRSGGGGDDADDDRDDDDRDDDEDDD